ncbi:hypothetical protein I203_105418 [Kwoniella mangroviensis CBS 8507]|uniref:uncharacterized protein n=1 Tax=Kwoniella mangroviensis CBS 8507 TaxID=1296122 RepID=UPI003022AF54
MLNETKKGSWNGSSGPRDDNSLKSGIDGVALPEEYHIGNDRKGAQVTIGPAPLAAGVSSAEVDKAGTALGSAVLRALKLRPPLPKDAPDAIATQPTTGMVTILKN